MTPLAAMPAAARARVDLVLTDIDDTLTTDGLLTADAFSALWRLHDAGYRVVPVTGRPAGWCDHIARMWPVTGVVGENGALAFAYDRENRVMRALHAAPPEARDRDRQRLEQLREAILAAVPGAGVASDQPYRLYDLAIDFREDVAPLDDASVARILGLFEAAGATAKVSSIHVNGWFGAFDKLSMIRRFCREQLGLDLDAAEDRSRAVYVGDSPNDEPAFAFFENSIGVANVLAFGAQLLRPPRFVTAAPAGEGFAEVAVALLDGASPATVRTSG